MKAWGSEELSDAGPGRRKVIGLACVGKARERSVVSLDARSMFEKRMSVPVQTLEHTTYNTNVNPCLYAQALK